MNEPIADYARIGLVHHLLYPACADDERGHAQTLKALANRPDIETFDCCLPLNRDLESDLVRAIRACGKADIVYATHFFPLRRMGLTCPLASEQGIIRLVLREMVRQAAAIGATGMIFASGGPAPEHAGPEHHAAFRELCRWLCGELKPHGITALLEPFDTDVDKCFLYGPTRQCVELVRSLQPEVDNFGIELDMAHLPLMGEEFRPAIEAAAPVLRRVHLGNCVKRDPSHPLHGDKHPPMGLPGGEIDVPELTVILRTLRDVGFLDRGQRGSLVLEMTPWPGRSVEDTIRDAMARLDAAWRAA